MKKIIISIIILFSLNFQAIGHVQHYDNYNYLEYELFRNNQSIGYHKYNFTRDGNNLSIVSEVNFKITKLGVDLYKYFAKSEEGKADKKFIVGTWWNHEIVKAKAQISGISGRIIEQTVTFIGKEEIKIGEKTFQTLHFNFKSSDKTLPDSKKLNTDIWYEESTYLWVKAAFDKTGHWEYRIKTYK